MHLIRDLIRSSNPGSDQATEFFSFKGFKKLRTAAPEEKAHAHNMMNQFETGNCGNNSINIIYRLTGKVSCAAPYFNTKDYLKDYLNAHWLGTVKSVFKVKFHQPPLFTAKNGRLAITRLWDIKDLLKTHMKEGDLALLEIVASGEKHAVPMTQLNDKFYIIADESWGGVTHRDELLDIDTFSQRYAKFFGSYITDAEFGLIITTENIFNK